MVKKAILTSIIMFGLYTLYVMFWAPKSWYASQHQWSDNIIKAQKFLYNESDSIQNVIVGTSLGAMIRTDSLPETYNLAFQGQSIYDGFNLLAHHSQQIKNVFVEANIILGVENDEFCSFLLSPVMFYPRKVLPSLRADKQPIAILGSITTNTLKDLKNNIKGIKADPKTEMLPVKQEINEDLFNTSLKLKKEMYAKVPAKEIIDERISHLSGIVSTLKKKGIQVIFFEMPVNYQLENMPYATVTRELCYKHFVSSGCQFISIPDSSRYHTSDGLHLTIDESVQYTQYLKSKIKGILFSEIP